MRFRPISADSQQTLALPGCYLFRTEVQLVSKWICRFFFFFAGMSKKAKNQVLTTHSECNNFVCVINQTFCFLQTALFLETEPRKKNLADLKKKKIFIHIPISLRVLISMKQYQQREQ